MPVVLAPAAVQGAQAPGELIQALQSLYARAQAQPLDVILLVRGGGSLEDLWAFNDEQLARTIAASPVPLVCGVGHETDFTLADFCADLRAPTPTAAAELVAQAREVWLGALDLMQDRLQTATGRRLDSLAQRLDAVATHLGRPSSRLAGQQQRLQRQAQGLRHAARLRLERLRTREASLEKELARALPQQLHQLDQRLEQARIRLTSLDPRQVLQRGYALLTNEDGHVVSRVAQALPGQRLHASLSDGGVDLAVAAPPAVNA